MAPSKRSGFSLLELVLVAVVGVVLAAILYPLFVSTERLPTGVVLGADRQPIPGAALRFRDGTGRLIATITADAKGTFRRRGLRALTRSATMDGFALTRYLHSSGGPGHYVFSPLGRQELVFRDAAGRPVADLPVLIRATHQTWDTGTGTERFERSTDGRGIVSLEQVPVSARFDIWSRDRRTVIRDVVTRVERGAVRTSVTAIPSATVVGRLILPAGRPLGGYTAFATDGADPGRGQGRYASGTTGPKGRFRITGLLPGTYFVSARPRRGFRSIVPARRVRVTSGGEATVELRAAGPPPAPR